jgi:hypothetical protein
LPWRAEIILGSIPQGHMFCFIILKRGERGKIARETNR